MIDYQFTQADLEYFLLIMIRVASFVVAAPFFSMSNTPNRVKIGLAIFVSVIIYQMLPKESLAYSTVIEYAVLVLREASVGVMIGLAANICSYIITFAGRIIDIEIGFSMVSVFDPITNEQVSITGTFYNYILLLILIASNMHQYILRALIDAYQLIPVGGVVFDLDELNQTFLSFLGDSMILGFRIVLPVFAVILVTNVILAVLAKVAPQMNMFVVGLQLKVLMGLMAMFLTIGLFSNISDFIFTEMKQMIVSVIKGMY